MGKTNTIEANKGISEETPHEGEKLPVPVHDNRTLHEQFSGKVIAIKDGKIIAQASPLKKLHETLEGLLPVGEGCHIKYVEESVRIYGSCP